MGSRTRNVVRLNAEKCGKVPKDLRVRGLVQFQSKAFGCPFDVEQHLSSTGNPSFVLKFDLASSPRLHLCQQGGLSPRWIGSF
jgi:hypothetical protein